MNRLAQEKSPYLLQHRENPVDWYPWGEEAFAAARATHKPIFLSIGYSTCYWCHVMEKDSFEKEDVAAVLNESFICVKVDREERPDVDQIYMEAVVALTGHGGWPMSVFLTPELQPFFCGTFFPHDQFIEVAAKVYQFWQNQGEDLKRSAERITNYLSSQVAPSAPEDFSAENFHLAYAEFARSFDETHGGFGGAPKFPPSMSARFLLRHARQSKSNQPQEMVVKTLKKMAEGGIYDQLGGGFHRYATDANWLVPHFEKMLYDNALLVVTYLEAYQASQDPLFRTVAIETLDYLRREMLLPTGGLASAQDAGEVGREGEYYVWQKSDLQKLLTPEEQSLFFVVYGITDRGNFEHQTNILSLQSPYEWSVKSKPLLRSAMAKVFKFRTDRVAPYRDDKVLTAWNGLGISAFAHGARIIGDQSYAEVGEELAVFIRSTLWRDGELLRRYRDGEAKFAGYLEDYAYLIQGLLDLYQCNGQEEWYSWAVELQTRQDELFWNSEGSAYFFAKKDLALLHRRADFTDSAAPSPNGISALNCLKFFHYSGDSKYKSRAEAILRAGQSHVRRYGPAFSTMLLAQEFLTGDPAEVVLSANNGKPELLSPLWQTFTPNTIFGYATGPSSLIPLTRDKKVSEGEPLFYLCRSQACQTPTSDLKRIIAELQA